jgi:hypothetical protein
MKKDYTKSYLVFAADLGYFESTARNYKKDALKVKGDDFSSCTPSFHLLSSLAFELFPKILIGYEICIKHKDNDSVSEEDIRKEISNEMKKYNHHLAKLYKVFPDLMKYLSMVDISEFKNNFVWEYRMKLGNNKEILLKNVEAARYGSFAKNRDVMTLCMDDNTIIDLLEKLEEYIVIKHKETNEVLKKNFK